MTAEERYPMLIGYSESGRKELHSVKEVATFICREGVYGDVKIMTESGEDFLDTFGIYINRISDMEYRTELLKTLIPMQKKLERGESIYELNEEDEKRIEDKIKEYLESKEYEMDFSAEIMAYESEGKEVPSEDFIKDELIRQMREQFTREAECEHEGHRWKETNADPENGTNDLECENCGLTEGIHWV